MICVFLLIRNAGEIIGIEHFLSQKIDVLFHIFLSDYDFKGIVAPGIVIFAIWDSL